VCYEKIYRDRRNLKGIIDTEVAEKNEPDLLFQFFDIIEDTIIRQIYSVSVAI
jgi:hypothetical protein